ncbi:Histone-lysine N-methyltransferase SETMAR [Araneus ventricosus]|uniref:Histone-lysine N-methyltransferase SETMAR n=1 Tax=Araneus ventricosus TaxID=182803 RepID=A0A4Y2VCP7_ARAVE|nr:Histone-lysine N-methyltransferase SETMAR [Araneus ventricosus]
MGLPRQQIRTIMCSVTNSVRLNATKKMCESIGINTVSYDTVKVWFGKFKAGNFDIDDEPCSGRPIEVDCEQLKQIIDQDRNVSTRTIALELDVCQQTIVNALKCINPMFKFNRWVPHELTAEDKRKRKEGSAQRSKERENSGQNCDL